MARQSTLLLLLMLLLALATIAPGCHGPWQYGYPGGHFAHGPPVPNPMFVGVTDPELVWTQLLDVLDDDFKVQQEERVRVVGDLLLEGRIETFPTDGSTILEPWRKDSTHGYEKWHATLQSIRRRAIVRVIPAEGGFLVDVVVNKELEDLNRPENATVDKTTFRYDGSLTANDDETVDDPSITLGWIPVGRDISLEQRILRQLQSRLMR